MTKFLKLAPIFLSIFILTSCLDNPPETTPKGPILESPLLNTKNITPKPTYQNDLFKEVTVDKTEPNQYKVIGKADNSVPSFNYIIKDGYLELLKGSVNVAKHTTQFGPFIFTFKINKKKKNAVLTLVLAEKNLVKSSKAKINTEWTQGPYSRQHTENYMLLIPLK